MPALGVIAAGSLGGALLVALLAPVGSRLRVPSIVAARAALGYHGAQLVAVILFLTNFVWIALNNVIAASITSRLAGRRAHQGALGGRARRRRHVDRAGRTPRRRYADRLPCRCSPSPAWSSRVACLARAVAGHRAGASTAATRCAAFDVVFGYQTSWLLMFGDYSRYSKSGRAAAVAVFAGLGLTALWFIPLGLVASTIARSSDPGAMVQALASGGGAAFSLVLATLTTNFVNIYMSALALKSLRPATGDRTAIWVIGGLGAAISVLSSTWLDQMANFTLLLAGLFVPVGGIAARPLRRRTATAPARWLYSAQAESLLVSASGRSRVSPPGCRPGGACLAADWRHAAESFCGFNRGLSRARPRRGEGLSSVDDERTSLPVSGQSMANLGREGGLTCGLRSALGIGRGSDRLVEPSRRRQCSAKQVQRRAVLRSHNAGAQFRS